MPRTEKTVVPFGRFIGQTIQEAGSTRSGITALRTIAASRFNVENHPQLVKAIGKFLAGLSPSALEALPKNEAAARRKSRQSRVKAEPGSAFAAAVDRDFERH